MVWEIEFTGEFEAWWNDLSADEQAEIDAKVDLLEERGPTLSRPHADRIEGSRHSNMKELRGKVDEKTPARVVRLRSSPHCLASAGRRQDRRSGVV